MPETQEVAANQKRPLKFRRKLLVLPKFQLLLIGINLTVILTSSLIIWIGVQYALRDLEPVAALSGREVAFFREYVAFQMKQFNSSFLIAVLMGTALSTGLTLILSHRLAGPIIRLRSHFRSISDGATPIPKIEFRDGDYLSDLPDLINKSIERIQSK